MPCGVATLRVAFFTDEQSDVSVDRTETGVRVALADHVSELSRAEATALRSALTEALTERRRYLRTAGERRADGRYVVARAAATSDGNRHVFESFEALRALYDRLPPRFDAETVGSHGLTGSRRHLVVRHFAEHTAFHCSVVSDRPLVAEKAVSRG